MKKPNQLSGPRRKAAIEAAIRAAPCATLADLGEQFGVTKEWVRQIERDMPAKDRLRRKPARPAEMNEAIQSLLLKDWRQTNREIAGRLGCSTGYVFDIRRKYGFPVSPAKRSVGETRRRAEEMLLAGPMRRGRFREVADALGVSVGCIRIIWHRIKPTDAPDLRKEKEP